MLTFPDIKKMPAKQRQALLACAIASPMDYNHYWTCNQSEICNLTRAEFTREGKNLVASGWAMTFSHYNGVSLTPQAKVTALAWFIIHEPSALQNAQVVARRMHELKNPLLSKFIVELLSPGKCSIDHLKTIFVAVSESYEDDDLWAVLSALLRSGDVEEKMKLRFFSVLRADAVYEAHNILTWLNIYLKNNEALPITFLEKVLPDMGRPGMSAVHLMRYLYDGTYDEQAQKLFGAEWTSLYLRALRSAYAGAEPLEVVTLMQLCFKQTNKIASTYTKNIFGFFLLDYFYFILLARSGDDMEKKIKAILNKKKEYLPGDYNLLDAMLERLVQKRKDDLERNLWEGRSELSRTLWEAIRAYVGRKKITKPIPEQKWGAVANEVYPLLKNAPDDALQARYGTPVLTAEKLLEPWVATLDMLQKEINSESASKKTVTDGAERLIYVVEPNTSYITVKRQKWLAKSERWSSGQTVGDTTFLSGNARGMDETDLHVFQACSSRGYYITKAAALPELIGCERVFTATGDPVDIIAEEPALIVKKDQDGSFSVETNLGFNNNGEVAGMVVQKSPTLYAVIIPKPDVASILDRLVSIKKFPAEAADKLRSVLLGLSGKIDVKSELVNTKKFRKEKGSATLSLLVTPTSGGFDLEAVARPLPGGVRTFIPGEGVSEYSDRVGGDQGEWCTVSRSRSHERDNLEELSEFFDNAGHGSDNTSWSLDPATMLDLVEFITEHKEVASLEWLAGKPMKIIKQPEGKAWDISIKSRGGWFEMEGDVQIDPDTTISIAKLMSLLGSGQDFVKLNETDYLRLSSTLRKQLRRLQSLAVNEKGHLAISPFKAAMVEDELAGGVEIRHDEEFDKMRSRIAAADSLVPAVPRTLHASLRPYQLDGFRWMERLTSWGAGACLADDMGLGKTVQSIAFMLNHSAEGAILVTAPASVVPNWRSELQRFAPSLNVTVLNSAEDRAKAITDAGPGDVIVTTYGLLNTQEEALTSREWAAIILDEAHIIKNRDTRMSEVAMKLRSQRRVILTGTPLQNRLSELWNLFRFINPGLLGSFESFKNSYIIPIENGDDRERRRHLQRLVTPFMLRRTKREVVEELPEKTEITLPVELNREELTIYESMRIKAQEMLEKEQRLDVSTLSMITRLREAACSPMLVDKDAKNPGSKVEAFMDVVNQVLDVPDNRMLVFSQFTSFLTIVRKQLDAAGIPYLYLDGATTMKQREKLVKSFQSGECPLFLISLRAGGLGLNLTEANYVVHLDPWWNPAIEQQATDRAHRIGQQRQVTVYRFIATNTIEEKILRLHATKRDLADAMLEGTEGSAALTAKDILQMLQD